VVVVIATEEQATLTLAASSLQTATTHLFLQRSHRRLTGEFQHNPRWITLVNMIIPKHIFILFIPLCIYTRTSTVEHKYFIYLKKKIPQLLDSAFHVIQHQAE